MTSDTNSKAGLRARLGWIVRGRAQTVGALDALSRETMQGLLEAAWRATGATVVLVTHSVDEALRLADRVVVVSPRPARVVGSVRVDSPRPRRTGSLPELREQVLGWAVP